MKKIFTRGMLVLVVCGSAAVLLWLNRIQPHDRAKQRQIVTSFYPLYFFTTSIVGGNMPVYNITPAGAEPHDYEPTTQDIARIEDSALLILSGNSLEAWGTKMKTILANTGTNVITVADTLATEHITKDGKESPDPHVWLDPVLAKKEVQAIAEAVQAIDPEHASIYADNARALMAKLDTLDTTFRTGLNNCQKKDIITSHAAFGYLANAYGLNQVAISGLSPDEEPSVQTLSSVADFARTNHIRYIFFESLVSPKLSDTIAREVGAQTLVLNPLEGLNDEEIQRGQTYFTVMEQNLDNLKIALACQ